MWVFFCPFYVGMKMDDVDEARLERLSSDAHSRANSMTSPGGGTETMNELRRQVQGQLELSETVSNNGSNRSSFVGQRA
jgi:hypothetical protein